MQLPDTTSIEFLHKEWPVIKAAPFSFTVCVLLAALIIWGATWLIYRERLARDRHTIEHQEREIGRLEKDVQRTREVSNREAKSDTEQTALNQHSTRTDDLDLELKPSEGQSKRMFLMVNNRGKKQTFRAQCRILGRRNDPNRKRLLTLDLKWERNGNRELEIHHGETSSLCIARADEDGVIEWIEIIGSPEPVQSQWAIGEIGSLPEYDVEIVVFGGENQEPYSEQFTIRAGRECAIEMFKLKTNSEVWEDAGLGGPQLHLNWDYPPEARFGGFRDIRRILQIENASPTDDALKVAFDDVTLDVNSKVSASIEPISRLMRNSTVPARVVLKGQFLAEHQGQLEMVYYDAQQIPERMLEKTRSGELAAIRFPMTVKFEGYGGIKYRAHFEFTADTLRHTESIKYLKREKLVRRPA